MAIRGEQLRKQILLAAKDVFLEVGFERASMDAVAARAETSKRTLYAHFGSKENLYLAVAELVRELYLDRLKTPDEFGEDPRDAVVLFCGRFLEILVWDPVLRTCRMGISESERLPKAAADYHHTLFEMAQERLVAFLRTQFKLGAEEAEAVAATVLGQTLYPRFIACLFGVEQTLAEPPDGCAKVPTIDLGPIRDTVTHLLPTDAAGTSLPDRRTRSAGSRGAADRGAPATAR